MGQLELCLPVNPMREGEQDGSCQSFNIAEQLDSLLGLLGSAGRFFVLTCAPFILAAQTLSPTALWIQLHQERDCTHSLVFQLGTSATASPGHAGRGQFDGWGQAAPGVL